MEEYYNVSRNRMEGADWIDLAQDMDKWLALVKTGMSFRVTQKENSWTSWGTISFSRRTLLLVVILRWCRFAIPMNNV
jgi:hypothetical protein